ncbi:glycosyltransferase [Chelatococcus asaccharovorans]|uniref:glycosyltransferase n=1 Tax=Chelatococcus asaccharovorans TaxID=28210 RepID=UPI00224C7835|nr:glycosyltransferase [Chelatococcus asaccharovorans]CAH1670800.1 putative glycosyltransferase [Chelatococcus asaccharovorans]CAH1677753.1 putative glycosyltransferase [Chelatococcus asaccharovorans]
MKILVNVTHLLGVGHLNRAAAIARALAAAGHDVTLVSGGVPSPLLDSKGVTVVQLPPVRIKGTAFSHLLDETGETASPAHLAARAAQLVTTLHAVRPDVVITELFPFGRRALAAEHLALLKASHAMMPRPLILSSARDVLAASRRPERITLTHDHLRAFYDAVLVHGDPAVLPLEASWPVDADVAPLLHYTGYIDDGAASLSDAAEIPGGEILVSGGGSAASLPLYRAAVGAARMLTDHAWRLLVGAGVSEEDFRALGQAAPAHAVVERARRDFPALLARAAVAVSQFGYNTAVDLLRAGTRAVVVPFEEGGETEQRLRAERFAGEGLVTVLPQGELSADRLAEAVRTAMAGPEPRAATIDRSGLDRSVAIIEDLAATRHVAAIPSSASRGATPLKAAGPLRWAALDDALKRRADRGATLDIWWRDDDAVAPTPALDRILAMAAAHRMPLALAVIPGGAGPDLAARLATETGVDVLVHGFRHHNHAPPGEKKAEFGDHRPQGAMLDEARAGLIGLHALMADRLVPAFVPPWNRIAPALAATLAQSGYAGLSTFKRRKLVPGLTVANTHCDPIDWRGSRSLANPDAILNQLARDIVAAPDDEPIGLLTHHLAHDAAIWHFCEDLIAHLMASAIVRPIAARAIFAGTGPAEAQG